MNGLQSFFRQIAGMQWSDYLDILLVAYVIYTLLPLIRTPNTMRIARAVLVVLGVAWLTGEMNLHTVNYILNQVLVTGKTKIQLMIMSKHYKEISQLIMTKFDRGTTFFDVEGGYTGQKTQAVMTVIGQRELFQVNEEIKKIDPEAFIVIDQVKEVSGYGFTIRKY